MAETLATGAGREIADGLWRIMIAPGGVVMFSENCPTPDATVNWPPTKWRRRRFFATYAE
jgi:hypothetical protein